MFDSGVGGLTVARAVMDALPNESLIYVGDNARFPYGPKPVEEIRRYALEIAEYLVTRGVKAIVVACNSVEVSAIGDIAVQAGIPVVGVIDPGMRAAIAATRNRLIGLIGTEATIASKAYDRAVAATEAPVTLHSQACPLFVEFVEHGDTSSEGLRAVAREYLEPLKRARVDALILGCTHYPLISEVIGEVMGPDVVLVSSATETAKDVALVLADDASQGPSRREFLCTGDPAQFREIGGLFLGPEIGDVEVAQLASVGGGRG
jgi:glutamate racemase